MITKDLQQSHANPKSAAFKLTTGDSDIRLGIRQAVCSIQITTDDSKISKHFACIMTAHEVQHTRGSSCAHADKMAQQSKLAWQQTCLTEVYKLQIKAAADEQAMMVTLVGSEQTNIGHTHPFEVRWPCKASTTM